MAGRRKVQPEPPPDDPLPVRGAASYYGENIHWLEAKAKTDPGYAIAWAIMHLADEVNSLRDVATEAAHDVQRELQNIWGAIDGT